MNYQHLIKGLQNEVKNSVRLQTMSTPYRVLALIALIPVFLVKWYLMISYYVYLFLYNALLSPVTYLEAWQDERSKDRQHFTEALIFLVSTPHIFFFRMILSIASFLFYFLWFELMCMNYLLTLGGIRWQPYLNTATFDAEEEKKRRYELTPGETGTMAFIVIAFALVCLLFLMQIIYYFGEVYDIYEIYIVFMGIYYLTILLVNPIMFRKRELGEGEEPRAAAPKYRQTNSFVNATQPYGQTYNQQPYGQSYKPYGQSYNNNQPYNQQPYGQTYTPAQNQQAAPNDDNADNNQ